MEVDVGGVVDERLHALFRQEVSPAYESCDYLGLRQPRLGRRFLHRGGGAPLSTSAQQFASFFPQHQHHDAWNMSTEGRWQIGQWFYRMVDDFDFRREFAMVAMNYLDEVLSRSNPLPSSKQEVQLLALTCFYLAVKLFQAGPVLSTQQMSMISGGIYTAQQVAAMEQHILFTLDWSLHPPCAADFLPPFVRVLKACESLPSDLCEFRVLELALGMVQVATLDYFFVAHQLPPSHLAAAALFNTLYAVIPTSTSLPTVQVFVQRLRQHTGCDLDEEKANICRKRLWGVLQTANHRNSCASATVPPPSCSQYYPYEGQLRRVPSVPTPRDLQYSPVGVDDCREPSNQQAMEKHALDMIATRGCGMNSI